MADTPITPGAGRLSLTIGELTPGTGVLAATGQQPTVNGAQNLGPIPMRRVSAAWKRVSLEPEPPAIDYPLTPGSGAIVVIGRAGSLSLGTEGWLDRLIADEDEALMLNSDVLV